MNPSRQYIHPTAVVAESAVVEPGVQIWAHAQVRENVRIGEESILGKGVYVDAGVEIGCRVKIQNGVYVYRGVTLEDGVFCGPGCVFTNDRVPRAVNPDGSLKNQRDWQCIRTNVGFGASIGANATIVCGVAIGRWAMVGAGTVVTRDVPPHALVYGSPARLQGVVCVCGEKLAGPIIWDESDLPASGHLLHCAHCGHHVGIHRSNSDLSGEEN